VNPWGNGKEVCVRLVNSTKSILKSANAKELNFKTEPGKTYIVERIEKPISSFEIKTISGIKNRNAKIKGRTRIGIPSQF